MPNEIIWPFIDPVSRYNLKESGIQGSTARKVGPRGPKDPAKFWKKRTKADHGPRKFSKRGPGRTADQWDKKSWSASYKGKIPITVDRILSIQETYILGKWWSNFHKWSLALRLSLYRGSHIRVIHLGTSWYTFESNTWSQVDTH